MPAWNTTSPPSGNPSPTCWVTTLVLENDSVPLSTLIVPVLLAVMAMVVVPVPPLLVKVPALLKVPSALPPDNEPLKLVVSVAPA